MGSWTNALNIFQNVVEDKSNDEKMAVPLDCSGMELINRLNYCKDPDEFERWHLIQLDWMRRNTNDEHLEHLCQAVASELRHAIMKAYALRYHTWCKTSFPHPFSSARHMVVSALDDVLSALRAFGDVNYEPDLSAVHIREMVQRYLSCTFDLMFVLSDLAPRRREERFFLRSWKAALGKSHYDDFRFDHNFEYAELNRYQMGDTNLSGAIPVPAQFPGLCLPHYPSRPVAVLNTDPYGPSIVHNLPSPQ